MTHTIPDCAPPGTYPPLHVVMGPGGAALDGVGDAAVDRGHGLLDNAWLFPAKMHEDPPEVLGVLLDPVVLRSRRVLVQEPENVLLELT